MHIRKILNKEIQHKRKITTISQKQVNLNIKSQKKTCFHEMYRAIGYKERKITPRGQSCKKCVNSGKLNKNKKREAYILEINPKEK